MLRVLRSQYGPLMRTLQSFLIVVLFVAGSSPAQDASVLRIARTIEAGKAGIRTLAVDGADLIVAGTTDAKVQLRRLADGKLLRTAIGDSGGFG